MSLSKSRIHSIEEINVFLFFTNTFYLLQMSWAVLHFFLDVDMVYLEKRKKYQRWLIRLQKKTIINIADIL